MNCRGRQAAGGWLIISLAWMTNDLATRMERVPHSDFNFSIRLDRKTPTIYNHDYQRTLFTRWGLLAAYFLQNHVLLSDSYQCFLDKVRYTRCKMSLSNMDSPQSTGFFFHAMVIEQICLWDPTSDRQGLEFLGHLVNA